MEKKCKIEKGRQYGSSENTKWLENNILLL